MLKIYVLNSIVIYEFYILLKEAVNLNNNTISSIDINVINNKIETILKK